MTSSSSFFYYSNFKKGDLYFKLYNMYMRYSHQQIILALSLLPGVGRRTLNRFLIPYRKILTNGYIQTESLSHYFIKHAQRPIPKDAFFYQAKDT